MDRKEAEKRIHEAYLMCQETFAPNATLLNDSIKIDDDEEALFCRLVSDFFLQQKQKEFLSIPAQKSHTCL